MSSLTIFALRKVRAYMTAKPWTQIIAEEEGFETFSSAQNRSYPGPIHASGPALGFR